MSPNPSEQPPTPLSAQAGQAAEQFETAYAKLQQAVSQLEQGNLTLSQSLQAYEQGVRWLKTCYLGLQEVEQQIRILTKVDADGQVQWEAFDASASTEQVDPATRRTSTSSVKKSGTATSGDDNGDRPKRRSRTSSSDDPPGSDNSGQVTQPRLF
ncbi:MAG: exodeoxyribonuclease VII small subunit [Planctomycetaceae bacterium]|nr:exodeoxyribonuclease VII small subunit [Planctomycetaceae bacterium]